MKAAEQGLEPLSSDLSEAPTEPRHAMPTLPDGEWLPEVDWDAPTTPNGATLDPFEPDERG